MKSASVFWKLQILQYRWGGVPAKTGKLVQNMKALNNATLRSLEVILKATEKKKEKKNPQNLGKDET